MKQQMTTQQVEIAIAKHFKPRVNLVVPNVSWGMGISYECDIVVLTKSGYAYEIEIKVSRGDLVKDGKKRHQHNDGRFRYLWFAVPMSLLKHIEFIPARAGILGVTSKGRVHVLANPVINQHAPRWSDWDRYKLARLGCLRIWPLKEKIFQKAGKK